MARISMMGFVDGLIDFDSRVTLESEVLADSMKEKFIIHCRTIRRHETSQTTEQTIVQTVVDREVFAKKNVTPAETRSNKKLTKPAGFVCPTCGHVFSMRKTQSMHSKTCA